MQVHEILLERDVINASEDIGHFHSIKGFIDFLQERETDPLIQRFISGPFWRWIINEYNDPVGALDVSTRSDPSLHRSLPDWAVDKLQQGKRLWLIDSKALSDVAIELIDYLRSLDDKRHIFHVPVDHLIRRAQEWHASLVDQAVTGEKVSLPSVREFPDGWRWVELTPEACQREGQVMQNCIAQSDYARLIREGDARLFSLRDPQDEPHVTIEAYGSDDLTITQIKGKQNKPPVAKYHRYIEMFLNEGETDFEVEGEVDLAAMKMITNGEKVIDTKRFDPLRLAVTISRSGPNGRMIPKSEQTVAVAELFKYLRKHDYYTPEDLYFSLDEHRMWEAYVDVGDKIFHFMAVPVAVTEGKKNKKLRPLTVGWLLSETERQRLLKLFPPIYPDVVAHHVTLAFNVPEDHPLPRETSGAVVGIADDKRGVQALVVKIGNSTSRPDGETYHITWSIDRAAGRKPKEAKAVVKNFESVEPTLVVLQPAMF